MSWLEPTPTDHALIAHLRGRLPDVAHLGRHLAPALRVEPRLLRNARLAYLPETDAGLEAAFWQCPLIESRSSRAVTVKPGVARLLTDELAADPAAYADNVELIERNTAHWPARERLEQSLRLDARDPNIPAAVMQEKLRQVLREIVQTTAADERSDIARWAKGAVPAIAGDVRQLPEVDWLARFAAATLGDPGGVLTRRWTSGDPMPGWLRAATPTTGDDHPLGLRWRPGLLECVPAAQSEQILPLGVPFPAPVYLRFEDVEQHGRWELVWPDRRIAIPLDCRGLTIQTLAGAAYRLSLRGTGPEGTTAPSARPLGGALILAYAKADTDRAQRIAGLLREQGLDVEPVMNVELARAAPDPDAAARVVHLWTREARREWQRLVRDPDIALRPVRMLRIEDTERPQAQEPPEWEPVAEPTDVPPRRYTLDWFDWERAADSPEAASRFADRLRHWLQSAGEPAPTPGTTGEPPAGVRYRTTARVNVRQGPGTEFKPVRGGPLAQGTLVEVSREDDEWRQVRTLDQGAAGLVVEGWVHARFLEPAGDDAGGAASIEVLSRRSILVCDHGGRLAVPEDDGPLTEHDLDGAAIVGCPNAGPTVRPCAIALDPGNGLSGHRAADGSRYVLPSVSGLTDGTPPGGVHYRVRTPVVVQLPAERSDAIAAERNATDDDARGPVDQVDALLRELQDIATPPERRLAIGDELARLGDPRKGVGMVDAGPPPVIDWVEIPAGPFLYGEEKETRELPGFFIARYPVTNAQFQAFVDDGGYDEKAPWWQGLAERHARAEKPAWNQPNRPRETVSWYEAVAFCRWLSDRLGYEVRLPTEYEWEKAARGTDGRIYPWGDDYRAGLANVNERSSKAGPTYLEQTTAVAVYPQGASPYGVEDMAGNVWEWCLNEYVDPERIGPAGDAPRALRGGAWGFNRDYARAAYRLSGPPASRLGYFGFRVVCASPIAR